ncbi:DUF6502 family protein [Pseudovibrio sp. Tun.PSC04-5.I4]|uniref:DUF6502 family protein n=1 Tax=Pseudovibrio sp. Tun.PSC04-5.I4 TaxID=1798213 RepID=UPI000887FFD8|nr:DUF6502 family protein [Pseudovibrio sp. Tun.PSC04-5.I4]SDQ24558.1 hypothetical protein SAMN04515695_0644 [Pseudovibrio sp. Tun.PSC04-5.I4]
MSPEQTDPFETALTALLAPLAKAMVARGVTIGPATEALKRALLQATLDESGPKTSDSRVSLKTGLHRKDVKRLRSETEPSTARKSVNAAALAISYWATAPEFQSENGVPRDLTRHSTQSTPGFDDLIRLTRADMAPGTVLEALVEQGVVKELQDGQYRLLMHALLPAPGSAEQVAAYQATLSTHMAAATHNLIATQGTSLNFDRILRYSHLSEESVEELNRLTQEKAQMLLEDVNAQAREMQMNDAEKKAATGRFAFGAYVLPIKPKADEAAS